MSDLSHYRDKVVKISQEAKKAEAEKDYENAFHHYMSGAKIFMHLIKYEKK